jgi:hypothetical protein
MRAGDRQHSLETQDPQLEQSMLLAASIAARVRAIVATQRHAACSL